MADNISAGVANSVIALLLNGTAFAGFSTPYVQLHIGAPGSTGSSNMAANNTRQPTGVFATPVSGATTNTSAINWAGVPASELYTHASLWSASTGGTFICSGALSSLSVTAGSNFQIPAGGLAVSLPIAS